MMSRLSRRRFLSMAAALPVGAIVIRPLQSPATPPTQSKRQRKDRGPRLDLDMVEEFVRAAHSDLDKVKLMLGKQPALANSTWDWGGGDWETGLGGASHMGRREIALYLLENKARLDIFAAAMLGRLDIVKASVIAFPGTQKVLGPHGIPLLAHAKKGGEQAIHVLKFLENLEPA